MKKLNLCFILIVAGFVVNSYGSLSASDYLDSPSTKTDRSLDLNDLYVWKDKQDESLINMVLTFNIQTEIPADASSSFNTKAKFTFYVDTDGDLQSDRSIDVYFGGESKYIAILDEIEVEGNIGFSAEKSGLRTYAGMRNNPAEADIQSVSSFIDNSASCTPTAAHGFACDSSQIGSATNSFANTYAATIALQLPISLVTTNSTASLQVWARSWRVK